MLESYLDPLPLIAILRGVRPHEVVDVAETLLQAGIRIIEVPLNSPAPIESITLLQSTFKDRALIGAGTILSVHDVEAVADTGARLAVMPHAASDIIAQVKRCGMVCIPGAVTPTECFAALAAGADALKLFPAEMITPAVVKSMRAVLPAGTRLFPVGGISQQNMAPYVDAGVAGFGIGSSLYRPGMSLQDIARNARAFRDAWNTIGTAAPATSGSRAT